MEQVSCCWSRHHQAVSVRSRFLSYRRVSEVESLCIHLASCAGQSCEQHEQMGDRPFQSVVRLHEKSSRLQTRNLELRIQQQTAELDGEKHDVSDLSSQPLQAQQVLYISIGAEAYGPKPTVDERSFRRATVLQLAAQGLGHRR